MARSTCVYAVLTEGWTPLAAFTVKHELVTWLRRQGDAARGLEVWRCGDGLSRGKPVELDVAELLGDATSETEKR